MLDIAMTPNNADGLSFEGFKVLAGNDACSPEERAGFGVFARRRVATLSHVLADMEKKIPALLRQRSRVLSLGIGCGELALLEIDRALKFEQYLVAVDSAEALARLPDEGITKTAGLFPIAMPEQWLGSMRGTFDAVVAYSVLQYVHAEGATDSFVESILELLAPGGRALIGDVPNHDLRNRFLASSAGADFHRKNFPLSTGPESRPLMAGDFTDRDLLRILSQSRSAGFSAWVLPQDDRLLFAGRREDILIERG